MHLFLVYFLGFVIVTKTLFITFPVFYYMPRVINAYIFAITGINTFLEKVVKKLSKEGCFNFVPDIYDISWTESCQKLNLGNLVITAAWQDFVPISWYCSLFFNLQIFLYIIINLKIHIVSLHLNTKPLQ